MPLAEQTVPVSKGTLWTGRTISTLVVLFLLFDVTIKLLRVPAAVEGTGRLGYSANILVPLGIVLLLCTVLYAIPRTSVLGAILLTGYLGGATASMLRAEQAFYFPVVFGVLVWAGVFLQEGRLRSLVPLRS